MDTKDINIHYSDLCMTSEYMMSFHHCSLYIIIKKMWSIPDSQDG